MTKPVPHVWRVFNGYVGNGAVHRIAVAFTAEQAIELVLAAGMKKTENMEAEEVQTVGETFCEMEDFDG